METIAYAQCPVKNDPSFVVYEWNAWDGFLISLLVPEATILHAGINHPLTEILDALPTDAQNFLFHLDCTITTRFPACRLQLISILEERGIGIFNHDSSDITKKTIQKQCASLHLNTTLAGPDGDPNEQLIVKTNFNFGGKNEQTLSEEDRITLGLEKREFRLCSG